MYVRMSVVCLWHAGVLCSIYVNRSIGILAQYRDQKGAQLTHDWIIVPILLGGPELLVVLVFLLIRVNLLLDSVLE